MAGPAAINHDHEKTTLRAGITAALRHDSFLSPPSILARATSLDNILEYREKVALNKSVLSLQLPNSGGDTEDSTPSTSKRSSVIQKVSTVPARQFRCRAAEFGFVFAMAMAQLLGEYLISGFSVIQPTVLARFGITSEVNFWPASLLSLLQCSTILVFARLSDKYGGYPVFMFGVGWLAIWSLVAGFAPSLGLLELSRAMQGIAIAAYTPACLTLFGSLYHDGPRKNVMLGIYGASAPVGFFAGISVSAALPDEKWPYYFWISASAALTIFVVAFLTIPLDKIDRLSTKVNMDWLGACTITPGLILVVYALSASTSNAHSWRSVTILAPFVVGIACLCIAFYIEGWVAKSPLLPVEFFKPKGITLFLVACVFFYACFGIWLFTATQYLSTVYHVHGIKIAVWFLPMALGGLTIAVIGSAIVHLVPVKVLLLVSGLAWLGAPLLLALADPAKGYWPFVFPAMLCGTIGIDLTFTVSVIFLAASQPLVHQGLAGAMSSLTINLSISFALACAQILEQHISQPQASNVISTADHEQSLVRGNRAAFWLAVACAATGLVIIPFVHISRSTVDGKNRKCRITEDLQVHGSVEMMTEA